MFDSTLHVFVNWEIFFFSDAKAVQSFQQKPLQYCGLLTDPVSQERFQPTNKSPRTEYRGRPYYFVSKANRKKFEQDPELYARRTGM